MADLFTHLLAGYVLATVLSWRSEWVSAPLVTVAMVGATLPDLDRIEMLIDAAFVEAVLGIPFSWAPLHHVGGTAIVVAIGVLLVPPRLRRATLAMLVLGAASHYTLDFFIYRPSGLAYPSMWPITGRRLANGGFYRSVDRWAALVATLVAGTVWVVDRRRDETNSS